MAIPILRELFLPPSQEEDESIYQFATRRFNPQIAQEIFDPLTLGVYAGDIHKLSLRTCFPTLHLWEQEHKSLTRALFKRPRKPSSLFTLQNGIESLILTLAQKSGAQIHLNTPVLSIEKNGVHTPGKFWEADHLISALPGPALGKITHLWPDFPAISLWVVHLTYPQNILKHQGFGYLIPTKEKEDALGAIWDSSIFPSSDGKTHLTLS